MEHQLFEAGLAPNTRRAYQTGIAKLEQFRLVSNRSASWPVPIAHVRAFLAYLATNKVASSTASTYIAGIAFEHKSRNLPDSTKNFVVKKMLEGYKRLNPRKDTRTPITIDMLRGLIQSLPQVCDSPYEAAMFKAAFLLSFSSFMRVSEFTAASKKVWAHTVSIQDIHVAEDMSVKVHLWSS